MPKSAVENAVEAARGAYIGGRDNAQRVRTEACPHLPCVFAARVDLKTLLSAPLATQAVLAFDGAGCWGCTSGMRIVLCARLRPRFDSNRQVLPEHIVYACTAPR